MIWALLALLLMLGPTGTGPVGESMEPSLRPATTSGEGPVTPPTDCAWITVHGPGDYVVEYVPADRADLPCAHDLLRE
jgi:hypothetical protein